MPMLDIFFENLSSFCDCSRSSTSIAPCIGSAMSLQISSFSSIMNTFMELCSALTIGKCHFARYHSCHNPSFCIQIIEVSDNWGCTVVSTPFFLIWDLIHFAWFLQKNYWQPFCSVSLGKSSFILHTVWSRLHTGSLSLPFFRSYSAALMYLNLLQQTCNMWMLIVVNASWWLITLYIEVQQFIGKV